MSAARAALEEAAADAVERFGPVHVRTLADRIAAGEPASSVVNVAPVPGLPEAAQVILAAREALGMPYGEFAAYLRGVAAGYEHRRATVSVEPVWSGPSTHGVPVRSTGRVLVELVGEAAHELVLMTYSAMPYEPLLEALRAAVARDVSVMAVVETLQGAGSALAGAEPASAFASVEGMQLWQWPVGRRETKGAKMHAKLAVADRRALLVSSANLTQSGVSRNIEAGLLVRGGTAPRRAAEHIAELRAKGTLTRLK
ncbi:DISARM system phospholipase D-like protein DrmC [Planomonospora sp. ID82291]|uniref:DISARM system phospholipase D-like protein DrmC n=1 Tax=Planomonospora sp. ID82291 TaxID=2738136 RepID=UPI0018C41682|nr:DISARM system phospholipase D-like protein DrmC [Planomonospora sp. ID82291]MBG0816935.1 endonuclease [Planomonospora sp. ID82291]